MNTQHTRMSDPDESEYDEGDLEFFAGLQEGAALQPGEFVGNEFALIELKEKLTALKGRARHYYEFPKTHKAFEEFLDETLSILHEVKPLGAEVGEGGRK